MKDGNQADPKTEEKSNGSAKSGGKKARGK